MTLAATFFSFQLRAANIACMGFMVLDGHGPGGGFVVIAVCLQCQVSSSPLEIETPS
jgi:hypothetical protein